MSAVTGSEGSRCSPQDAWANVKIPMIKQFEMKYTEDVDGWFNTTKSMGPMDDYTLDELLIY